MKTVIEMAREAGFMKTVQGGAEVSMASIDCLERFAELVRADAIAEEREACAKVCDRVGYHHEVQQGAELAFDLAAAIRERSANSRARSNK